MRRKIIILFFVISSGLLFAQNKVIYSKDVSGNLVAKNKYGKVIAIGKKDYLGDFVWKDLSGNVIKKEVVNYLGGITNKDKYGQTISTSKKNYLNEIEERDTKGVLIAKYRTNYLGEIERIDVNNNIIGKYSTTSSGEIQYSTNKRYKNSNKSSYANPKIYEPVYSKPLVYSDEYYAAIGNALAEHLSGFGIYTGYNSGVNFGFDIWLSKWASYGLHYGITKIDDARYGVNTREEMALNLGFYINKHKNLILKTSWGYTDLGKDYDAYPDVPSNSTFEQWEIGYNQWVDEEYQKFFYKIGIQFALSKKKKGAGLSPEIYYSNNGIGFGLGYIFNRKNPR